MVTINTLDFHNVNRVNRTNNSSPSSSDFSETLQATAKKFERTDSSVEIDKTSTPPVEESSSKEEVEVEVSEEKPPVLSLEYLLAATKVGKEEAVEETIDFSALFQVNSVEELTKLLGGNVLPEGEQLTLPLVANALGMTETNLQQLISKLTGNQQPATDLWTMLNKVDQNLFPVLQQLASAINGHSEAKLNKKEAQQAVALIKLVQLAGPKTDLALKQESLVAQTKDWLSTLASQITTKTAEKEVSLPFAKSVIRFQNPVDTTQQATNIGQTNALSGKVETVTIQLPANATPTSQAAKFVEEFQSVMNRAQFANNAAGMRLLIKIYPENLGTIRVELVQKDGMLSAKLLASNALGKQILDSTLHQLKQGLANQNIQLDRVDVAQSLSEPSKSDRGHQFGQQTGHNHRSEQDEEQRNVEESASFEELLAELEE